MKKQLYFIRHGQTQWNVENRMQGWADIPLNETGRKQALLALNQLKSLSISRFFSSDLSRAKETAEILNSYFKKPLEVSPCLREFYYGEYEGKNTQELWKKFDELHSQLRDLKNPNRNNLALPGGETCLQVMKRVIGYLSEICKKYPENHFMISSHGGVIYNLTVLFAPQPIHIENCDCIACSFDSREKTFSDFKLIPAIPVIQKKYIRKANSR